MDITVCFKFEFNWWCWERDFWAGICCGLRALSPITEVKLDQNQKVRKMDLNMDPTIYYSKVFDWDYRTKMRGEVSDIGRLLCWNLCAAYGLSALSLTMDAGSSWNQKIRKADLKTNPMIYDFKIFDWENKPETRCEVSDAGKFLCRNSCAASVFVSVISHHRVLIESRPDIMKSRLKYESNGM